MDGQMEAPINLDGIASEFFRDAIRRGVRNYVDHFGERLVAIYIRGSVQRNEAVPGISDLDMMAFIADAPVEADREWWDHAPEEVEGEVGRPIPLAELFGPPAPEGVRWQMVYAPGAEVLGYRTEVQAELLKALRYNATLVWGRDITEGLEIPPPDLQWANEWYPELWDYVRDLAGLPNEGRFDPDPLPRQPSLQLRTLARHAVSGGAYLLAGLGEFRFFRGADILPALERRYPEWAAWLEETRGLYIEPRETTPEEVAAYLSRLVAWMEWIGQQLEKATRDTAFGQSPSADPSLPPPGTPPAGALVA